MSEEELRRALEECGDTIYVNDGWEDTIKVNYSGRTSPVLTSRKPHGIAVFLFSAYVVFEKKNWEMFGGFRGIDYLCNEIGMNTKKTVSKKDYIIYNTFSDVLKEDCFPLFNYGRNDNGDQLSMLSLFSGCGGMDIGFEGGFICNKRSVPANSRWIERVLNEDWVLLKKNRFNTIFANDILDEAVATWGAYMNRFDKEPTIYHKESIVDLVKKHLNGADISPKKSILLLVVSHVKILV